MKDSNLIADVITQLNKATSDSEKIEIFLLNESAFTYWDVAKIHEASKDTIVHESCALWLDGYLDSLGEFDEEEVVEIVGAPILKLKSLWDKLRNINKSKTVVDSGRSLGKEDLIDDTALIPTEATHIFDE